MNLNNYGLTTGRLTQDPIFFTNKDGSRRCRFTIAASNAYKSSDGSRGAQFIPIEAFIPSDNQSSIYDILAKGMLVTAQYEVRNNNFTDKDGVAHYDIVLQCEAVRIQESKAATEARRAAQTDDAETE